jgi:hypothetical protein
VEIREIREIREMREIKGDEGDEGDGRIECGALMGVVMVQRRLKRLRGRVVMRLRCTPAVGAIHFPLARLRTWTGSPEAGRELIAPLAREPEQLQIGPPCRAARTLRR